MIRAGIGVRKRGEGGKTEGIVTGREGNTLPPTTIPILPKFTPADLLTPSDHPALELRRERKLDTSMPRDGSRVQKPIKPPASRVPIPV